jgi:hypothetical protein
MKMIYQDEICLTVICGQMVDSSKQRRCSGHAEGKQICSLTLKVLLMGLRVLRLLSMIENDLKQIKLY